MDYEVKLEIFEGPLDLLLHLIHKNEVDIFDIPIATITDQYLEYIEMMKALNINVVGDFLVVASTLVHIKSRMLLPEFQEEEEGEDPRLEIARPLMEYMRFREVAKELSEREILDRDVFARAASGELRSQEREESHLEVSLFLLIDAFKRIVDQKLPSVQLKFQPEEWSVKDKMNWIITRLKEKKTLYFQELFEEDRTVSEFIVTFLALLELAHVGLVKMFQVAASSDIRLVPSFEEEDGDG